MMRPHSHNESELRQLFDTIDTDGSHSLTMDEWCMFTVTAVKEHIGEEGLKMVFRKYDRDGYRKLGDGLLDIGEFARAAEELGFSNTAGDVFMELDADNDVTISYVELFAKIQEAQPLHSEQGYPVQLLR